MCDEAITPTKHLLTARETAASLGTLRTATDGVHNGVLEPRGLFGRPLVCNNPRIQRIIVNDASISDGASVISVHKRMRTRICRTNRLAQCNKHPATIII
jgi:hypothetical protein